MCLVRKRIRSIFREEYRHDFMFVQKRICSKSEYGLRFSPLLKSWLVRHFCAPLFGALWQHFDGSGGRAS
jgi:hypothetical protein